MAAAIPRRLRVAVLDDYLGLSAKHLASTAKQEVTVFKDTLHSLDSLVQRLEPYDAICTMRERTPFSAELLHRLPNLRLLLCTGTQHSQFDIAAATRRGILVATATGDSMAGRDIRKGLSHPTTQHTWALLLSLVQNIPQDDANLKSRTQNSDVLWQTTTTTRLQGKTLGICGLGRLGVSTARLAVLGFGMKVLCWSQNLTQEKANEAAMSVDLRKYSSDDGEPTFQVAESKEAFFQQSDIVSVHYVLSARSRGLIGRAELAAMKPTSFLVNTSRGPIIEQGALIDALKDGSIAGAALDVFDVEPLPHDSPLRKSSEERWKSRLVITPHMGYVEEDIMNAWYHETAINLDNFVNGRAVVNRLN